MTGISFDPEAIRALAGILTDTGLTEIEIVEKDSRIRVARAPATLAVAPVTAAAAPASSVPKAISEDSAPDGAVHSPMVGIAYLSPEPGAPPFVQVGQRVSAGQTLLLIEAMKTFNQIKAPRDGVVTRILVNAGAPVEYDEPLLILQP
jgi:acetyl-CoA carboxylase biotin carboxyl carrier protein